MVINLTDTVRFRTYDRLNWTVDEYRAPERSNANTKSHEPRWVQRQAYFMYLADAVAWAYDHILLDSDCECDLEGAIRECRNIRDALIASVMDAGATESA